MNKVISVEYEVACQIISDLLQKGLISRTEFEAIDKENLQASSKNIYLASYATQSYHHYTWMFLFKDTFR